MQQMEDAQHSSCRVFRIRMRISNKTVMAYMAVIQPPYLALVNLKLARLELHW